MKSYKLYIIFLLGLVIVGGGIFYISRKSNESKLPVGGVLERVVTTTTYSASFVPENIAKPAPPPEGYVKYENKKYGFYYYHSPEATIKEYDEGGGAMTIVQENIKNVRGMQIFIIPYSGTTISEERFKMDVPSGVRKNVQKTFIGERQIEVVTFNSYDSFLGETREVWFIYKGHLYEVTTFSGLGEWFVPLMQSWRFLN